MKTGCGVAASAGSFKKSLPTSLCQREASSSPGNEAPGEISSRYDLQQFEYPSAL
jgi:hypothetical protein